MKNNPHALPYRFHDDGIRTPVVELPNGIEEGDQVEYQGEMREVEKTFHAFLMESSHHYIAVCLKKK